MEDKTSKTVVDITDEKLEEEINKLDVEVIPTPKIDNIKSDLTFKLIVVGIQVLVNHVYLFRALQENSKMHMLLQLVLIFIHFLQK